MTPTGITARVLITSLYISWVHGSITRPTHLRCYNKPIDATLCPENSYIRIHHAFYADSGPVAGCDDSYTPQGLCRADISTENPSYFRRIQEACNGRRACHDLVAEKHETSKCNTWLYNPASDYVLLEYTCDIVPTTVAPTTQSTTLSSTTSGVSAPTVEVSGTTVTEGYPGPRADSQNHLGVTVGVPVLIIVLVAGIILVLLIVRYRKRTNSKEAEENGTAKSTNITYSNALYTTADSGDVIYDKAATVVLAKEDSLPAYVDMNMTSKRGKKKLSRKKSPKKKKLPKTLVPLTSGRSTPDQVPEIKPSVSSEMDRNRIYSLEKAPGPDPESPEIYQSYDPYVKTDSIVGTSGGASSGAPAGAPVTTDTDKSKPGPPSNNIQYMEMNNAKRDVARKVSDPYSYVGQPSRLEELEGVYSIPRNSGKVLSQSDENLSVPKPVSTTLDNVPQCPPSYENIDRESRAPHRPPRSDPEPAEYSEVGMARPDSGSEYSEVALPKPAVAPVEYGNISTGRPQAEYSEVSRYPLSTSSETFLVDNPSYSKRNQ